MRPGFKAENSLLEVAQTKLIQQNRGVDISRLRLETASDHASVEDLIPVMDTGLRIETYVGILLRFRPFVAAWETCLASHPERPADDFVAERNRLSLLIEDLDTLLSRTYPAVDCKLPVFEGRGRLMGAMYVMEGSRLGGQLIARHVEKTLALAPGNGTRYLRGFADRTGLMWKEFLELMRVEITDDETSEVIVGAKQMFSAFQSWMKSSRADTLLP